MTDGWDDEQLLTALGQALSSRRAVPADFVEAGKNAFTWHNVDAELARLTYDSLAGAELTARTRSEPASIRALTFTSARLTIELEVTADSLLGQIVPAQLVSIGVQAPDGTEMVITSDEIGCFLVQPIPQGSFRLRCRAGGGVDVLTGWVTL